MIRKLELKKTEDFSMVQDANFDFLKIKEKREIFYPEKKYSSAFRKVQANNLYNGCRTEE